jgi:hypothetical protein
MQGGQIHAWTKFLSFSPSVQSERMEVHICVIDIRSIHSPFSFIFFRDLHKAGISPCYEASVCGHIYLGYAAGHLRDGRSFTLGNSREV